MVVFSSASDDSRADSSQELSDRLEMIRVVSCEDECIEKPRSALVSNMDLRHSDTPNVIVNAQTKHPYTPQLMPMPISRDALAFASDRSKGDKVQAQALSCLPTARILRLTEPAHTTLYRPVSIPPGAESDVSSTAPSRLLTPIGILGR